jgi:L-lactate dehydrogenase complex protein LldE
VPQDRPREVQLLVTCIVDSVYPAAGEAVVAVLEQLGVRVRFPHDQTCCGQPAYNAGFRAEARQLGLRTLELFEASPAPVVVPSGSCAAMLVHGYADLFAGEPGLLDRAKRLAGRTYELSQFLTDVLKVDARLFGPAGELGGRTAYHPSCHLARGLGVHSGPRRLLESVPDVELAEVPEADECCGFGGLFSLKHADVSAAMLDRKLDNLRASGATQVVGCDMSCLMHIAGGLQRDAAAGRAGPVRCVHLAEVLAAALRMPAPESDATGAA